MTDHARLTLRPGAPWDFGLALDYVRRWSAATLETIDPGGRTWRRALRLHGRDVLLTLSSAGTADAPCLTLDIQGAAIDDAMAAAAAARVSAMFNLTADPTPLHALARDDPPLRNLLERFGAIRPVLVADLFETLIWAVLGQQINVAFARKLKLALVEVCDSRFIVGDRAYPLMPPPEAVAALDPAQLLAHQFSRQKAAYTIDLAGAVASGELDLEGLRALPRREVIDELTRFKGIGRWTAEYVLMRGLGDRATLPAGDVSLQLLLGHAYAGRRVNEAELRVIAMRWPGWAGWVAFYIWLERITDQVDRAAP